MSTRPQGYTLAMLETMLAPLKGRRIVDIGCGGGHLLRALAEKGARVAGIDPDEAALELARKAAPKAFLQKGGAEKLPFGDGMVHAAIFLNSLHHVPVPLMSAGLAEAARVVGRGGSVVVIEPLPQGSFFEAMRPIEDETRVRLAAQQIIARILQAGVLIEAERIEYERVETFANVDAFIDRAVGSDPVRRERALNEREKIMTRFDILAEGSPRGFVLRQPLRLQHLKVPGAAEPVTS